VLHEIKNPLVAIGGFARNLWASGKFDEKDREKIEIIMNEAERLENYLGRFQSNVSRLKIEDSDINQIVEDVCQLLQIDFSEHNIELLKSFAPGLPGCRVDQVKLHEAILNIMNNAIEAIGSDGRVWVKTWTDGSEGLLHIEITDDGGGIPKEKIARIFTPFYTTKEAGSGLGLAFVHRIVRDHGGNISVTSSKGKGTTFVITLPAYPPEDLVQPS
jgi:signal transduction histidine kinase